MGCEGWSEGWGGTGFGMGAAGVLWMGFHGMGLLGWGVGVVVRMEMWDGSAGDGDWMGGGWEGDSDSLLPSQPSSEASMLARIEPFLLLPALHPGPSSPRKCGGPG